jgi:hypothetical protein
LKNLKPEKMADAIDPYPNFQGQPRLKLSGLVPAKLPVCHVIKKEPIVSGIYYAREFENETLLEIGEF